MFYKVTLGDELNPNDRSIVLAYITYDITRRSYRMWYMPWETPYDYERVIIEETLNSIEKDIRALGSSNEIHKYIQPFVNCIKIKPVTKEEGIEEILGFIDETIALYEQSDFFAEYGVPVDTFYTCGGCGEFFSILKAQFPFARCFATPQFGHILTEIDGVLYDVNGIYDCFFDGAVDKFLIQYEIKEQTIKESFDQHEPYYIYLPNEHPAQKLLENYAFSVNGEWGWGPVSVRLQRTLEVFTQEQREKAFEFLGNYDCHRFENRYNYYEKKIYENDIDFMEQLEFEADGIYIPV